MTRARYAVWWACALLGACGQEGAGLVGGQVAGVPDGAVEGVIVYDGPVPRRFKKKRRAVVTAQLNPPRVLVTEKGLIADAVVTLESLEAARFAAAAAPLTVDVDQMGSVYSPHVVVVPVGGAVQFLNSDLILHNVHARTDAGTFAQRDMPPGSKWTLEVGSKERAISIGCNFHPWMAGHVRVVNTRLFGKSDLRGQFRIPNVPDGRYRVQIWHAALRAANELPMYIDVKDGRSSTLRLAVRAR